jgi:response regulator RpfG family c-di-GMP phosphodiesterase
MNFIEGILSVINRHKKEKQEILVIDNRFQSLEFLKNTLCRHYKVLIAQDKEEGLTRARLNTPALIILNCKLYKESTLDVCALLRKFYETQKIPVVMIAEKGSEPKISEFYAYKIDGFLKEPFSKKMILNQIQTAFLDRRC